MAPTFLAQAILSILRQWSKAVEPDFERLFARRDFICQLWHQHPSTHHLYEYRLERQPDRQLMYL